MAALHYSRCLGIDSRAAVHSRLSYCFGHIELRRWLLETSSPIITLIK